MIKPLELSFEQFRELKAFCAAETQLDFLSTPFDELCLSFLVSLGVSRIKIASGEINYYPMLRAAASYNRPLILSTGMATLPEVHEAIEVIEGERRALNLGAPLSQLLTLLHCTSNYPANPKDMNLRAMITLRQETGLSVGLSDHSTGIECALAAVALGACVIEKHFTIDKSLPGPDHQASLSPLELRQLVDGIRKVEAAMGDGVKEPRDSELPVRNLVRRSITARRDIEAGEVFTLDNIACLRPGTGLPPKILPGVLGRGATVFIPSGSIIRMEDIQS
jgi:sialic acid synthase SpsE